MIKHFKKSIDELSTTRKYFYVFVLLFDIFIVITSVNNGDDTPIYYETYEYPHTKSHYQENYSSKPAPAHTPVIYRSSGCEDWLDDKLHETIIWQDFLEEIETRGIDLNDPEAAEIWEMYN
jgi:hypothetical protein